MWYTVYGLLSAGDAVDALGTEICRAGAIALSRRGSLRARYCYLTVISRCLRAEQEVHAIVLPLPRLRPCSFVPGSRWRLYFCLQGHEKQR